MGNACCKPKKTKHKRNSVPTPIPRAEQDVITIPKTKIEILSSDKSLTSSSNISNKNKIRILKVPTRQLYSQTIGIQTDDELMMGFILDRKKKFEKMKQFFNMFEVYEKFQNTHDKSFTEKIGFSNLTEYISKGNHSKEEHTENPPKLQSIPDSSRHSHSQLQDKVQSQNLSNNDSPKKKDQLVMKQKSSIFSMSKGQGPLTLLKRSVSVVQSMDTKGNPFRNQRVSLLQKQISNISVHNSINSNKIDPQKKEKQEKLSKYFENLQSQSQNKKSNYAFVRSMMRKKSKTPKLVGISHDFFKKHNFTDALMKNLESESSINSLAEYKRRSSTSARKMSNFRNKPISVTGTNQNNTQKISEENGSISHAQGKTPKGGKMKQSKFRSYNTNISINKGVSIKFQESNSTVRSLSSRKSNPKSRRKLAGHHSNRVSIELTKPKSSRNSLNQPNMRSESHKKENVTSTIEELIEVQTPKRKNEPGHDSEVRRISNCFGVQNSPKKVPNKTREYKVALKLSDNSSSEGKNTNMDSMNPQTTQTSKSVFFSPAKSLHLKKFGDLTSPWRTSIPKHAGFQFPVRPVKQSLTQYKSRRSMFHFVGKLNHKHLQNMIDTKKKLTQGSLRNGSLHQANNAEESIQPHLHSKTVKEFKEENKVFNIHNFGKSDCSINSSESSSESDSEQGSQSSIYDVNKGNNNQH